MERIEQLENEKMELLNYVEDSVSEQKQTIQTIRSYEDEIEQLKEQVSQLEKDREIYISTK